MGFPIDFIAPCEHDINLITAESDTDLPSDNPPLSESNILRDIQLLVVSNLIVAQTNMQKLQTELDIAITETHRVANETERVNAYCKLGLASSRLNIAVDNSMQALRLHDAIISLIHESVV